MSKEPSAPSFQYSNSFRPKKRLINGALISFERLEADFPAGTYYYEVDDRGQSRARNLYPSVYSMELDGYGYVPRWSFFADAYYEDLGFLTIHQINAWTNIADLRNRGLKITLTKNRRKVDVDGGDVGDEIRALDKYLGRDYRLLRDDLDRLEDALLIHRVRRTEGRGTPDDIIIHTPFTPKELYRGCGCAKSFNTNCKHPGGWASTIQARIDAQVTRSVREKKMITGVGRDGRAYKSMPRPLDREHHFTYDRRFIYETFKGATHAFLAWALKFFQKNVWALHRDKQAFDRDYRDGLRVELGPWGIVQNPEREKCYVAANKFRVIYCPSYEELLAV